MPYPLLKLPYGLQQRLRSLSTPKEAYCLQVAAGFERNYLQPLQRCSIEKGAYISNQDENIILTYKTPWFDPPVVDYDNDSLVRSKNIIQILYLEPSDYDSPVFDHVLFNGPYFTFFKSVLNPATFNKVLLQCQPEQVTMFAAICYISSELTIPFICDTFKNIQQVLLEDWDYALKNWMQDILSFRKLNLSALKVGGEFEKLFSFEPDELSQLFEREDPEFGLCLACWKPPPNAIEIIREKFGAHFKEFFNVAPPNEEHPPGFLHIKLGITFSGFKEYVVLKEEKVYHYWFQVKS